MSKRLKVAAVGLGRWANILASQYTKSSKIELVSCFTRSEQKRSAFADKFGCSSETSYDALLKRPDLDAIIVTVPNDMHAEVIEQAAIAGKHVCVEKPISNSLDDARRIIEVVKQTSIKCAVLHSARRLGAIRKIKEIIDSGRIGEVSTVEVNFSNERGLEIEPGNWRGDPVKTPGGPLIQLGVHQVDNLQFLLGKMAKVFCFGKPMYTKVENTTVAQALIEFESGKQAYLAANWACPGVFTINVYGTKGNIYYNLDFTWWSNSEVTDKHSSLTVQEFAQMSDDPDNRILKSAAEEIPVINHLLEQIEVFADVVHEDLDVEITSADATHNLATILAAVKSIETGSTVEIGELEKP